MNSIYFPKKQGLYDPQFEHDNCGVGFVCNFKGLKSHDIIKKGIRALENMEHRGATGADPKTGDGAGILIQIPHRFFEKECEKFGIKLPETGSYGAGMVFLPTDKKNREYCEAVFENVAARYKLNILGWREVPIVDSILGKSALETKPVIKQVFVSAQEPKKDCISFEQTLYIVRKRIENIVRNNSGQKEKMFFSISNLSSKTLCYKGLLTSTQLEDFFPDLKDADMQSSFSLIHARYSTNTFPTWDLAQPFRYLAHNGEINTLRGNINWMQARQGLLESRIFGNELNNLYPIIVQGGSDSASIDNMLELLVLGERSIAHAMMMLIPEAWQNDKSITKGKKDFYKYHACLMEPWDGPASIAFTDGRYVGAILDRNGLRPARYVVTDDNIVVMASETGVLDIPAEKIITNGRLQPGKMFLIDTHEGRILDDEEIKKIITDGKPYGKWLDEKMVDLDNVPSVKISGPAASMPQIFLQKVFGYSREDIEILIKPMAAEGKEPIGSMGDDTPLAVLSKMPRLLYDYFKQLFAQVTNPAIDPIREELVMSLESYLGKEKNLMDETKEHCHRLRVKQPILTDEELEKIRNIDINSFKTKTISTLFDTDGGRSAFCDSLNRIQDESVQAIKDGYSFIILSDRGVNREKCALPALLSTGAVHHHLVRSAMRTQIGIVLESGEPREVMHFALLLGYGADCINPYLVYATIKNITKEGEIKTNYKTAEGKYIRAIDKGLLKVLSKMGISTLQSYRGAQIFEALGLNNEIVDKYFTGTISRIGGIGLFVIAEETIKRHKQAFAPKPRFEKRGPQSGVSGFTENGILPGGGLYKWRRDGEFHLWNPNTIPLLQQAVRKNDYGKYKKFADLINNQAENLCTLRGVLKFKNLNAVPPDEIEPADSITKRFVTGAMSFGSISREAHETIAVAMNRLGAKSNSGEGGEDPSRFIKPANGDNLCSATKQVASGRFGVTINYLVNAKELQIKIAQGAKPGEGGQLPGHKVSAAIAKTRYSTPGVTLISPPPHHDIYSIEDLAQLIFDLKNANPEARINVKLVSEAGVGTVAAGVAKGHADAILISGGDGGTGASPLSSIKHAGLPWELGLSETHQTLVLNNLRNRVRLQTDGQMRTGRDVIVAAILGAEEFGFATSALVVLGCTMLRHCNLNNCALGIATQEECLRKKFSGKPEYLENYFRFVAEEARQIMTRLGARTINELIGRTDLLEINTEILHDKAMGIDFSRILYRPNARINTPALCTKKQQHGIDNVLDRQLIELSKPAIEPRKCLHFRGEEKRPVNLSMPITNKNRTIGTMLSGEVTKQLGEEGLPQDTIYIKFTGTAGQSFGAFLAKGITLELEGDANDYVGKGLSGGKIIIYPSRNVVFKPEENVIIGNTSFYGATSGEAYIRGIAGERFCIRNSGLYAVAEGVGDHSCEYMTGGRVVILGRTGRNFAAGMSGGIAYIYDKDGTFSSCCNKDMVELEGVTEGDETEIYRLLTNHYRYTLSAPAKKVMDNFRDEIKKFIKVIPVEYKRVMAGKPTETGKETELAPKSHDYFGEFSGLAEVSDG